LRQAVETLGYISLVAYAALALATINHWRIHRDLAAAWAAVCFGTLGVVFVLGQIVPEHPDGFAENFLQRLDLAFLLLFPYLLHRFTTVFRSATSTLESALGLMTVVMLVGTFALPHFPEEGESRPGWFIAYLIGFLAHWTILSSVAAVRLWRAGRGQPSVSRRRMRLLAYAAGLITVALFAAAATSRSSSGLALASQVLALLSALAFLLALAPPAAVRVLWRRPAQERVQDAIRDLIILSKSQAEVAQRVLGPMADIVGARAVCIRDDEGRILASHGFDADEREPDPGDAQVIELPIPSGSLKVWASPYAPFFGREELRLLDTVGALTGLALDRVRLFQQEHEVRLALERADELKTNFIALASHELRTPVTTIHGLASTLNRHGPNLAEEQRRELRDALERQAARMAKLVDQLLDLSRLDADAITINPERINVRERLEEIVSAVAAERADEVQVGAPADLEASADPAALERIVGNLVTNALRYGAPPVVVDAEQRDRHFRVYVEDRGDGVPSQFVPELFERFTRSGREHGGGTGLGLAIARSYARAHDGDLVYEDADPHGARFKLILPARGNGDGNAEAEPAPEVQAHGWRLIGRRRSEESGGGRIRTSVG
jgi:signal transduction histidine kinase